MSAAQIEIQLIASVVAVACSICGVFLVLRQMAMMSDAISHAILLGIVLAFFATGDLASPFLIVAAALTGLLTVTLVEALKRTGLVREDAAIGLVFPLLFSVGVILISRHAGSVHLDTDAVLLGELAFAPFNRLVAFGYDLGPKSLYVMSAILALNLAFILVFFKELKLATFDTGMAAALGFSPGLLHYGLMGLVSLTAVGAFDAVGSILVVAFMIAPPATAYLLCHSLPRMLVWSGLVGVACAISGYWVAHWLDASIAGSMATMAGVLFVAAFLFAPERGRVALARRRARQRWDFGQTMLTIHLFQHEDLPQAVQENRMEHLEQSLRWQPAFAEQVVRRAERRGFVVRRGPLLELTASGREHARQAIVNPS
ncbi:MAG: metal ABC transporter permease [bacterium]